MPFEIVPAERGEQLLQGLLNFREKLIHELSRPEAPGSLEERHYDVVIDKLAAVQGCIAATREYFGKT